MDNHAKKLTYPTAYRIIYSVINMLISRIRHDWPEKAGFRISRPQGVSSYTFLHFSTAVQFRFGDELVEAGPGACIFFAPETPQWFRSAQPVIHNWMHAGPELHELLARFAIPENCLLYPGDTAFISELFRKIEVESFSDNPHREQLIDGLILEFLIRFSRSLHTDGPTQVIPRGTRDKLRSARRQILSQPEKKWTVAEMAALASLSPSRFHAVYKALFGTAPLQDVIDARIRYAKSLLLSDETLTLPEVAEKLGYQNHYHFIRQFKAVTGRTPGAYRKATR